MAESRGHAKGGKARVRIVIGGLPGVGKTSVLTGFVKHLDERGLNYRAVVFGTVMHELAKERGEIDRDSMRKLSMEDQRELQVKAAERISAHDEDIVIVDTHYLVRTPDGFYAGLPSYVIDRLHPSHLVFIYAKPEDIIKRRLNDKARMRDDETVGMLEEELFYTKSYLAVASAQSGAEVIMIENEEGMLEKTIKALMERLHL